METVKLSPFQQRVLLIPETWDVFLGGGRGGAKSFAMALLALRHVEQHADRARVLYLRKTYKGLADFETITRELFSLAYGKAARYNAAEHVWRFVSGAYVELGQLESAGDYDKYQGRSFTLLLVDEAGQYADPTLLDRVRSNLRGNRTIPVRMVIAANPGGVGHTWLASRYVFAAPAAWTPFPEPKSGREWVYAPSVYRDNPFIDAEEYATQLEASCVGDPELLRSWLDGDWAVARGAYFASVLDETRNAIDAWDPAWGLDAQHRGWYLQLAHDYGSAAPSVTFLVAESPGDLGPDGRWYPRGSLLLLDELATNQPSRPSVGLGWTIPRLAEAIRELAARWSASPAGVADDSIFADMGHGAGSIAQEFGRYGVYWRAAGKGSRVAGWEAMRRMLEAGGKPDCAGLYISRRCHYFWDTVPFLPRDPRRVEDVDSSAPDHAADAARYALVGGGVPGSAERM